ncbi:hypothetical protein K2173_002968 [Erythroxylum novogranatense]|uniref:MSP domain-containing protein n=1 Tax=Erythroxylum novogranatense TaxID=1862640 RepID=A0AAV8TTG6_9ROSI|nr:hypothetical protein K2173_002968 [Erythroxylum novogranatense]
MERLVELSDAEVCIDFVLNSKCRATVSMRSLSATTPVAFKIQTSSPHKFLVNPPTGIIPPLSVTTFQIILKPQVHVPTNFPRSPSDRFLIKTAPAVDHAYGKSLNLWFAGLPQESIQDFKLKVSFVGQFLLHHAVSCADVESVKAILRKQKSILADFSQKEAESLLRVATGLGNSERMVNLLLEAGLKIDARVERFCNTDLKWQSNSCSAPHLSTAFDRVDEVLDLVKERGCGESNLRDKEGRTALHLAISKGNIECARALVESGADKDARSRDGRTALYMAAANGDHRMVEMLVEMGADPTIQDDRGCSALDAARDEGRDGILELLERGEQVLMAARRGDLRCLETLLRSGANVNYRDQYGLTALHAAAIKGHRDVVSMLVEYGLDLECSDNEGHTPLHLAVEGGSLETVKVLALKGANVGAKNGRGATPMCMAEAIGYVDISQFLVQGRVSSSVNVIL